MRAPAFIAAAVGSAFLFSGHPASAQVSDADREKAAIDAAVRGETSYDRLPAWTELSTNQQSLVGKWRACSQAPPAAASLADCWNGLSHELRATFFMITYVLEKSIVGTAPLTERVSAIEGVLVPDRVNHHHDPTNVTATVDGWRIHISIQGLSADDLRREHWPRDRITDSTHTQFGYTLSFRDYRERDKYDGPFLQLVLNAVADSSDSDLDKGAFNHQSSPKAIYERFIDRFPETEKVLKIS